MSFEPVVGMVVGISAILSSSALGVRWLVRHYFDEIKKELKPNSGSSIKDQVTRLEKEMQEADLKRREMSAKLDHMYEVLLDYVSRSNTPTISNTRKSKSKNS